MYSFQNTIYILATTFINNTPWQYSIHEHNILWIYAATGHMSLFLQFKQSYSNILHYHSKFRPNFISKLDKQTTNKDIKTHIAFYLFETGQFALNKLFEDSGLSDGHFVCWQLDGHHGNGKRGRCVSTFGHVISSNDENFWIIEIILYIEKSTFKKYVEYIYMFTTHVGIFVRNFNSFCDLLLKL
jgi:hypothetical protein